MNIQSAITQGAQILKDKSCLNPYLDSEILMSKAINKDKKYLILNSQKKIKEINLSLFQKLINERSKGKPVSHLTNKKFFWNSEFYYKRPPAINCISRISWTKFFNYFVVYSHDLLN